jgi:hypothetical protein
MDLIGILRRIMNMDANETFDQATDSLEAIANAIVPTAAGNLQIAHTTIDLNQAAANYNLFTGTTQDVVLERLALRMPNVNIAGGALTSISIQTDDVTPQVLISAVTGALANLTQEAQVIWLGVCIIHVATIIQLTIAGGAAGVACVCDIVAEYRAVVAGGTLA